MSNIKKDLIERQKDLDFDLEIILIRFANQILDLQRTNGRLADPIDEAKESIDKLYANALLKSFDLYKENKSEYNKLANQLRSQDTKQ